MSEKPFRDIIQDPVHGFVTVEPHEKLFIDSPVFQRLRRIKQLQSVHLCILERIIRDSNMSLA